MSDVVLHVEGLSKRYRIGAARERYRTARDTIATMLLRRSRLASRPPAPSLRAGDAAIWALKNVSFDVRRGEVVGVIGRNGAGKSTLLKILSRITDPTEGCADVAGRVGSLLEVGTGFHAELTGYENVYLSGAILGMKRAEIARRFDEIVTFAGVEPFIHTPVKHYSTGMHLRLAFAVAAHLDPEILLIDEVLAVGDLQFQKKCLGQIDTVHRSGRTVLFVSHDMSAMLRLTSRAVLLEGGRIRSIGPTESVVREYSTVEPPSADLAARRDRFGDGSVRIDSLDIVDAAGRTATGVPMGEPVTMVLSLCGHRLPLCTEDLTVHIRFTDALGHPVATLSTRYRPAPERDLPDGHGWFTCEIPHLLLAPDLYFLDAWIDHRGVLADFIVRARDFDVAPSDWFGTGQVPIRSFSGAGVIDHRWAAVPRADDLPVCLTAHAPDTAAASAR